MMRHTSTPPIPGMLMSSNTASNCVVRTNASASSPLHASTIVKPRLERMVRKDSRIDRSSSTIITVP